MAKKPARGARSQAVRDYLKSNPSANVKTVVEELAKGGMKVSAALVGAIKYAKAKKKRRRRVAAAAASEGLDIQKLIAVKKLVNDLGGVEEVRKALTALEKLM